MFIKRGWLVFFIVLVLAVLVFELKFSGFDVYSCPDNADQRPLEIKTESNHPIDLTLCISRSGASLPEGFVLDDPASLAQNPFYKYANLETKRKLFNTYVAQHPSYVSANAETKEAIHSRFGVSESDDKPFDPDAYLAKKGLKSS